MFTSAKLILWTDLIVNATWSAERQKVYQHCSCPYPAHGCCAIGAPGYGLQASVAALREGNEAQPKCHRQACCEQGFAGGGSRMEDDLGECRSGVAQADF